MIHRALGTLLLILLLSLAGCGVKGDLFLPDDRAGEDTAEGQ